MTDEYLKGIMERRSAFTLPGMTAAAPPALAGMPGVTLQPPNMPGVTPARQELRLGLPVPAPAAVALPALDILTLLSQAFAVGNRMIVIVKDDRGRFQTSMKRPDGVGFAVEIHAELEQSIRGALNPLLL